MKTFVALAAGALLALAFVGVGAAGHAKSAGLVGEVGPGFSIEVKKAGKDLKTIKHGTYTIKIEDKSTFHIFHLKGPGLNKLTTVAFKGDRIWTITLRNGMYTYQCDPHAQRGMKGTFKVTEPQKPFGLDGHRPIRRAARPGPNRSGAGGERRPWRNRRTRVAVTLGRRSQRACLPVATAGAALARHRAAVTLAGTLCLLLVIVVYWATLL